MPTSGENHRLMLQNFKLIYFLRDWTLNEKLRYNDYPPIPFQTVEVPLWTKEEQYNYITRRIAFHTLPPADKTCTDEERWRKPTNWPL